MAITREQEKMIQDLFRKAKDNMGGISTQNFIDALLADPKIITHLPLQHNSHHYFLDYIISQLANDYQHGENFSEPPTEGAYQKSPNYRQVLHELLSIFIEISRAFSSCEDLIEIVKSKLTQEQQTKIDAQITRMKTTWAEEKGSAAAQRGAVKQKAARPEEELKHAEEGNQEQARRPPAAPDNAYNDVDQKKIDEVHRRLVKLTDNYLTKKNHCTAKISYLMGLKAALITSYHLPKIERIQNFQNLLEEIDKKLANTHRTETWKRYIYNACSIIAIIPGLIRAGYSYSRYGSAQFWKPDSEKVIIGAKDQLEKIKKIKKITTK